jgi:hypothetical protein
MQEVLTETLSCVGALGAGAAIVAMVRFWMEMGATKTLAERAEREARAIAGKLADYMLAAERGFATTGDLANAERRFAEAVDGLRHDFARIADPMDHLLEMLIAQHSPK